MTKKRKALPWLSRCLALVAGFFLGQLFPLSGMRLTATLGGSIPPIVTPLSRPSTSIFQAGQFGFSGSNNAGGQPHLPLYPSPRLLTSLLALAGLSSQGLA